MTDTPHSIEAERSALGSVLIKPAAFDELASEVVADDFYLPAHRLIFESMAALDGRRQAIDPVAIVAELRQRGSLLALEGGEAYLMELGTSVPTAENLATYARIVREKATLRRLIGACAEIQSAARGDFGAYEDFLDEAEGKVFRVAQRDRRSGYLSLGETMPGLLEGIEARARDGKEITGVPSGFSRLDGMTAGLQPENLVIVAGRPGTGKTAWAINVAVHAALKHKIPVLIFSLEMSRAELMERMLAAECRIDSTRIRRGLLDFEDWRTRVVPAGSRLSAAPILIDDGAAPTILEIRSKARRFRGDQRYFPTGGGLGLVVVDYLQLARGVAGRRDENREREVADISRGLKALAKDLKLPVMALAQLNRGVEHRMDKTPQLSDLRESGAIEQDADLVLFIHREAAFSPEANPSEANLIVGKNRHGSTGAVPLTFIKEYTRFENYAEDAA